MNLKISIFVIIFKINVSIIAKFIFGVCCININNNKKDLIAMAYFSTQST